MAEWWPQWQQFMFQATVLGELCETEMDVFYESPPNPDMFMHSLRLKTEIISNMQMYCVYLYTFYTYIFDHSHISSLYLTYMFIAAWVWRKGRGTPFTSLGGFGTFAQ